MNWLSDERYAKLKGQTRLQVSGMLDVFNMYGQDVFIPPTVDAIMLVIEETWDVIRGEDKPIDIETLRRKRR